VQPGRGLLHPDGLAEHNPCRLRLVPVPVQRVSGRDAAAALRNYNEMGILMRSFYDAVHHQLTLDHAVINTACTFAEIIKMCFKH
jgi:hypothetical protein